jgi:hypothetical protein
VGENDLGYLFGGGDPGHGMAYPVYFDDNILTRLIGLSGGVHISYAAGGLNNNYSFRPTAFTVYIDGIGSMGGRHALRSVTDPTAPGLPVPGVYRSTVFQRCPTSPPFGGPERTPDWREIATVWPHGRARARININTASMPVLAAVFNTTTAADIIRFRPYRDICDVLGYSGFVGYEGPTAVETSEIRRRFIPSACRPITSPNAIVQRLRQDRRLPTGSVNDQQELFRGDPFFTKNAYYTLFAAVPIDGASAPVTTRDTVSSPAPGGGGAWLVTCHPPLDYDDSGAGRLYDDLADDVGERMEWFSRYWDVIDIKSRFFTVIARGRAFDPTKLVGDARVRAIVERQDIINNLNGMRMTTSGARGLPTPGADGITDAVKVLSSRFITEY